MVASSFLVITNSLRLNSFPDNPPETEAPFSTTPSIEIATLKPSSQLDSKLAQTKTPATDFHVVT